MCCLQKNTSTMLRVAGEQCPVVMGDGGFRDELRLTCEERGSIPANFTHSLLVEQVGTDLTNKIR